MNGVEVEFQHPIECHAGFNSEQDYVYFPGGSTPPNKTARMLYCAMVANGPLGLTLFPYYGGPPVKPGGGTVVRISLSQHIAPTISDGHRVPCCSDGAGGGLCGGETV